MQINTRSHEIAVSNANDYQNLWEEMVIMKSLDKTLAVATIGGFSLSLINFILAQFSWYIVVIIVLLGIIVYLLSALTKN